MQLCLKSFIYASRAHAVWLEDSDAPAMLARKLLFWLVLVLRRGSTYYVLINIEAVKRGSSSQKAKAEQSSGTVEP